MTDIGLPTIMVAAGVGALTLAVAWRRPFVMLAALILLLPFRDLSTRWMNAHTALTVPQVTAIGRWWFVVILALIGLLGLRWVSKHLRRRRWPRLEPIDLLFGLVALIAIGHTILSPARSLAFTSLRGYFQPLGVFFLARAVRPSRPALKTFLALWLLAGFLMAAFGLWQVAAWSEQDYRKEGYVRQDGDLVVPYAYLKGGRFLRPASTVSGPNELGLDMVLLFLLAAIWLLSERRARPLGMAGLALLFVAGLAVTVSRSALLGLLAAAGGLLALYWRRLSAGIRSLQGRARLRAMVFGLAGITAALLILNSTGMLRHVGRTFGNLTTAYHVVDSIEAVQYLAKHPQGAGMGLVEPKGALALIEAGGVYHVEGSIFQIGIEMGVWGLAAWLAFWGAALARIWRNWNAAEAIELRVVTGTAFAGWLGSLVAFLFLPLMQSISLMVWLWFLLGMGYQSKALEAEWAVAAPSSAVG